MKWSNGWHHFLTITEHKRLVMKYCFQVGPYRQGILHDLSKYSFTEFCIGARYYYFEYWIDFSVRQKGLVGNRMPLCYVLVMHEETKALLERLLKKLRDDGEAAAFYYMRELLEVNRY